MNFAKLIAGILEIDRRAGSRLMQGGIPEVVQLIEEDVLPALEAQHHAAVADKASVMAYMCSLRIERTERFRDEAMAHYLELLQHAQDVPQSREE